MPPYYPPQEKYKYMVIKSYGEAEYYLRYDQAKWGMWTGDKLYKIKYIRKKVK